MVGEATRPSLRKTLLSESSFTQPYMHGSPQTFRLPEGEAAVVPPEGVSIRRPPKVCEACWITITIACQIRQDQSTKGESKRPSSLCRPRFLFPSLFLSPGAWGPPESRAKMWANASCWASWVDFLLFPSVLQKRLRKNIEKSVKIEDFGLPKPSQNPPKTPPKSMSQKTSKFSLIFNRFLPLVAKAEP